MKTHVIHLAAHDDYHSARDQMTWAKSARILLVLPRKERILRTQLDLVLLERQAASLGAQLALVTDDEVVMGNAEELKIPVFETIKEAQHKSWKATKKKKWVRPHKIIKPAVESVEKNTQNSSWIDTENTWFRVIVFSFAVISLLVLLIVLLPQAEIRIQPQEQEQSIRFDLRADPNVKAANMSGLVPLKTIKLNVEAERSWPSSGITKVGDIPASGELVVTNLTGSLLTIPEGTIFLTMDEPIQRFYSTQPVKLDGIIGATEAVPIQAQLPGSAGNVEKGSIQGIEGPIGLKIMAINPESLVNGTDRENSAPTEQDLKTLEKLVAVALEEKAKVSFQTTAGQGSVILPDSLKLEGVNAREQDPEIGVPADAISLKVNAEYSGSYIAAEDIQDAAALILDANLPKGFEASGDKIKVEVSSLANKDGWRQVLATRPIVAAIDPGQIAQIAAGKTINDFKTILGNFLPLEGEPQITLQPFFLGRFPFLAMRINVRLLQ